MTDDFVERQRPQWVDGEQYSYAHIRDWTWSPDARDRDVDPETMFVYRADAGGFEELVEPSPFSLVPAASLEEAVAELRSRGLGARDVARAAGVSIETAERAFSGNGHVRRSTRDALLRAAANGNGDR